MVKQGRRKLTEKSDSHGTCRVVVLLIKRIVLPYHVSVPLPPTQQRRSKKVNSRCFKLHRYYTISKLNFEQCRWIFLNLQYSTQGQEKIEKKIIREPFFFTSSMKIKIRTFSRCNVTKKREAHAKRNLFCWSDPLLFCSNVGAARTVFPHWSQKIITNLPIKRSFSYSVISLVFKGFQNIGIYVRIYFHAVVLRPLNKG